jgi:hypothetical protein
LPMGLQNLCPPHILKNYYVKNSNQSRLF